MKEVQPCQVRSSLRTTRGSRAHRAFGGTSPLDSNDLKNRNIIDTLKELDAKGYWPEDASTSSGLNEPPFDGASILREVRAFDNSTSALYEAFCRGAWQRIRRKYNESPNPTLEDDEIAVLAHCVRCGHQVGEEHATDVRWRKMLRLITTNLTPEKQALNERRFIEFYSTRPNAFSEVAADIAQLVTAQIDTTDPVNTGGAYDDSTDESNYDSAYDSAYDSTDESNYDSADDSVDDSADDSDVFHDAPSPSKVGVFMEALTDAEKSRNALKDSLESGSSTSEIATFMVDNIDAGSKLCSNPITHKLVESCVMDATNPRTLFGTIRQTLGICHRIFATTRDSRIVKLAKVVLRACKSILFACITGAQYVPMMFESIVYGVYAFSMQYVDLTGDALLMFTRLVRVVCRIGTQLPGKWKAVSSSIWFRMTKATVVLPFRAVVALVKLLWSVVHPSTQLTDPKSGAKTAPGPQPPPSTPKRCPSAFPRYCTSGPQSGYCVSDLAHCNMIHNLSGFTRKKPTERGTGDLSTGLPQRRG